MTPSLPLQTDSQTPRRRLHIDPHVFDVSLALVSSAAAVAIFFVGATPPSLRAADVLGLSLVLLATLPLALLHVRALLAYWVMLAAAITLTGLHYETVLPVTLTLALALFIIAVTRPFWEALVTAAGTGVLSLVALFVFTTGHVSIGRAVLYWLGFSVLWLLGLIIRVYRESAVQSARRAALFAQDRDLRAREAVAQERQRLARELHDGVGHALNVVVLHAQGARRVLQTKPQLADEALGSIETAGRQALVDVERMLGLLRAEADDALAARPGLGQLAALAAQVTEAGLPVEVRVVGQPVALPSSLDLTAYRIVQEALTNALKHAGRARAAVQVTYAPDAVELEITDTGRGPSGPLQAQEGGHGVPGMYERVAVFGGALEVGPRAEGGFRVWARLPLVQTQR